MEQKVEKRLIKSLTTTRASEISSLLGEVALDQILTDGILKDIPIIGSAISLLRTGNDIQAYLFTKKIIKFLVQLEEIPAKERSDFLEKHTQNDDNINDLGERLLSIINNANDSNISTYLGKAFKLFIQEKITKNLLDMYIHVISSLNSYIIEQTHQCYKFENAIFINGDALHFLMTVGLINGNITPHYKDGKVVYSVFPEKSIFGQKFYEDILS